MLVSKNFSKFATLAVTAAVMSFAAVEANATHFRYGTTSWVQDTSTRQVQFTFTEAWRTTFIGTLSYNLGDGSSHASNVNRTIIGNFTDAAGEGYTLLTSQVTHTYASNSVFNVTSDSCCRISSLVNAGDDRFRVNSTVDLSAANAGDTGSPIAQAPVIIAWPQGPNTFQLPFADPDSDNVTVTANIGTASPSSGITSIPTAGANTLSVSATGLITWDATSAPLNSKYAFAARVTENDSQASIPLDFIIEVNNAGANNVAPTVDGASFTLEVGDTLMHTVTGNDPDAGPNPLSWNPVDAILGPDTVTNALFDENTQELLWDTTGYSLGVYTFFISNFDGVGNGVGQIVVNLTAATVSEPGILATLMLGIAGMAFVRRRKQRAL